MTKVFVILLPMPNTLLLVVLGASATAQSPDPLEYYRQLRRAGELVESREYAKAVDAYRQLAEQKPENAELWMRLGDALDRMGQPKPAAEAWQNGLQRGCRHAVFYTYDVARAYARAGEQEPAIQWLERALAAGYERRPSIAQDDAFTALRSEARFRRLVGESTPEGMDRVAGWRLDLEHFLQEVKRLHYLYRHRQLPPELTRAADALRGRIPELSNEAILIELMRLAAMLGDGHTQIYPVGRLPQMPQLPLRFYLFSDGLYVIDADRKDLIGRRVVRFGEVDAAEMLRRVEPLFGRDNEIAVRVLGPLLLAFPEILKHLGGTNRLALADNEVLTIEPSTVSARFGPPPKLMPSPLTMVPAPLYLRKVSDAYWFERLPDRKTIYFQFNQVMDKPDELLSAFAERLRRSLQEQDTANLIIDVRHNNGGNAGLLMPLLRVLVAFDTAQPGARLFVITSRYTYSAAQIFINNVQRWTRAIFVGEPSGSSPNFVGEDTELLLPFSGVRGSISSRYHQSDGLDQRKWIAPRIPAELSSSDYFANLDPALDAILRLIAE